MVEEGDKDMGKTRTVEESIRGKERENVRVAKKDRKKVTVEGDGRGGGGVERVRMGWGRGVRGSRSHGVGYFYEPNKHTCAYHAKSQLLTKPPIFTHNLPYIYKYLGQVHCNQHYHIPNCILQEPSR